MVHVGQLKLEVEIGAESQALDHGGYAVFPREIDQQPVHLLDSDPVEMGGGLPHQADALLPEQVTGLQAVASNSHQHLPEQVTGPGDDVQVAVGDGVEGAGAQHLGHDSPAGFVAAK